MLTTLTNPVEPDITRGAGAISIANGGDASNVTLNTCNIHDNGFGNVMVFGIVQTVAVNSCTLDSPGLNPGKGGNWYYGCNLATENWSNNITMTGGTMAVTTPGSWMNCGVGSNANGPSTMILDGVNAAAVNEGGLIIGDTANLVVQNGTVLNDGVGTGIWIHGAATNGVVTITDSTMDGLIVQHGPDCTLNMTNVAYNNGSFHSDGPRYTVNATNVVCAAPWDNIRVHPNSVDWTGTFTGCTLSALGSAMFTQATTTTLVLDSTSIVTDNWGLLLWGDAGARATNVHVRNGSSIVTVSATGLSPILMQTNPDPKAGVVLLEDSTFENIGHHNLDIQGNWDVTIRNCTLNTGLNAAVVAEHMAFDATIVMDNVESYNPPWGHLVLWVNTGVNATITNCYFQGGGFGVEDSGAHTVVNCTDTDLVNMWHGIWTGRGVNDGDADHTYTRCHWWHDHTLAGGLAWPALMRESNIVSEFNDCTFGPTYTNAAAGHAWDMSVPAMDSVATLNDCVFTDVFGGCLHIAGGAGGARNTINVNRCTIGGGTHNWGVHSDQPFTTLNVTDSYFFDGPGGGNVFQLFGAGLRMNIDHCVIEKKVFATHAIWVGAADNVFNMNNCFMVGGKYYIVWVAASGTGTLVNNTFIGVDNAGDGSDVCVWFRDGTPSAPVTYRNNVAYGFDNAAYDCYCTGGGSRIYQDNVVYPSTGLADVGFTYPATPDMVLQADSALADPHLVTGSPLINAGTFVAGSLGSGTVDYDRGDDRVAGPAVDIGADEFVPHLLSIVRDDATPTESRTLSYTVTFDNPVYGVDPTDFVLGGTPVFYVPDAPAAPLGSIYRMPLADDVFTVTEVGGGVFTVVVDIMAGAGSTSLNLVDDNTIIASGTPLNGSDLGTVYVGEVYDVTDTLNPNLLTIELINGSPTSRDTVDFRFTFDELMEGPSLVPGSSPLGGANSHVVAQSPLFGTVANLAVTLGDPDLDGTVNAWIDAGLDMVGLPLATNFSSAAYTIDNAVPIIWNIVRTGGAPREQADAAYVAFTIQFDMLVTGVDEADFVLTGTYLDQTTAAAVVAIQPPIVPGVGPFEMDAIVWTGYPSPVESNSGTLRLDTVVAPTIYDAATGTHQLGGPFAGGEDYDITNVPRAPARVPGPWMLY